eukprot:758773-Prymnesium_polylepis.1
MNVCSSATATHPHRTSYTCHVVSSVDAKMPCKNQRLPRCFGNPLVFPLVCLDNGAGRDRPGRAA